MTDLGDLTLKRYLEKNWKSTHKYDKYFSGLVIFLPFISQKKA